MNLSTQTQRRYVTAPPFFRTDAEQDMLATYLAYEPGLLERRDALVRHSREANLGLRSVGMLPLFSGHQLHPGSERDWLLVNLRDDPLWHDRDGLPLPRRVMTRLEQLAAHGIEFDQFYLAHELPPGAFAAGDQLTFSVVAPPPPAPVVRLSQRLGRLSQVCTAVMAAPLLASWGLASWLRPLASEISFSLDPILFGAVLGPEQTLAEGTTAAWFYLDHWVYNEEA
ncbi:MAG: hypothetical protein MUD01_01190 [Chloroflexaceae bacterium]|jgi:hypothetical protein|nr:hypothetical protein [Chloroflexaceae bacterium]